MHVTRIISRRFFRHENGGTASVYGASPYGPGWQIVTEGHTVVMSNGTVGLPSLRDHSLAAVVRFANRLNDAELDRLEAWAVKHPDQRPRIEARLREIPFFQLNGEREAAPTATREARA